MSEFDVLNSIVPDGGTVVEPAVGDVITGMVGHGGCGTLICVESLALLLAAFGSETVPGGFTNAVLVMVPVLVEGIVPVAMKVTEPPARRLTGALMFPLPEAGHEEPGVAEQVQLTPVTCAGNVSVTVAPVTEFGPEFDALMRYVIGDPASAVDWPSLLVMDRSAEIRLTLMV